MYQMTNLSHADAAKIVAAVQAELEKTKRGAAVAVCDGHGELVAFLRIDGCRLPSITIAQNKAFTATREQRETSKIGENSRKKNTPMTNYGDLRYVAWGGGVPVLHKGEVIGGVGVSGLSEEEDIELALLGIKAGGF